METSLLLRALESSPAVKRLSADLPPPGTRRELGGAIGSLGSAAIAALHRAHPRKTFVTICESPHDALSLQNDLEALLDNIEQIFYYPQEETLPYEDSRPHFAIGGQRVEAVEAILSGRARVIVTSSRSLQERVPIPVHLTELRSTYKVGDQLPFGNLSKALEKRGFERVSLVEQVGHFAVRGGILDVFSVSAGDPV